LTLLIFFRKGFPILNLLQISSFLRIKKIVLTPLFDWKHPDEWSRKLYQNGLCFAIEAMTAEDIVLRQLYSIASFNDLTHFQPVFVVKPNIILPDVFKTSEIQKISYPVRCSIELIGSVDRFDFDAMLVTDEG
jgi:hypothetical protein